MQIGCHVSISGSIDKSVDNAVERNCSAFQIFTRSPRSWHAKDLTKEDIDAFKSKLKSSKIDRFATCAHMPYLPNLATPKNDVIILLENTAGQKNSVGSDFKQLGEIFKQLKPGKKFGVCLDTCHAFVAGYDLRTADKVKETFKEFDKHVGIENLKILHLNDARGEIGCNLDRHYHLGLGGIGEEGITSVVKFVNKKKIPIILETPIDDDRDDFENVKIAKGYA